MPYFTAGDNLMLDALGAAITHASLLTKLADRPITGVASTDILTSATHAYANGDIVVVATKVGGTGLIVGKPYFVVNQTTNTFQLAETPGGTPVNFTTNIASGTVNKYQEMSGGTPAYARKSIAFGAAAANGVIDDTSNGVQFDVPAQNVDAAGYHTASSGGTILALSLLAHTVFGNQGLYMLDDAKLDLDRS